MSSNTERRRAGDTTMSIIIYFDATDATDPSNEGWAFRDDQASPLGSGPIGGDAADALTDLAEHGVLSEDQRSAIDRLIDVEIGAPRAQVVLQGIGPLYP